MAGRSTLHARSAALCEQLRVSGLQGFGLERPAGGRRRRRRARPLPARDAEGRSRARAHHPPARDGRPPARRSDDAAASRGGRGVDGGRSGSLLDEIDRTVTPMGGRLLRAWLLAPAGVARAHSRAARRGRGTGLPRHRPRQGARHAEGGARSRAAGLEVALSTASPRDLVALARSLAAVPRTRLLLGECRRRSSRRSSPRSTICPRCATPSTPRSSTSRRRWPATAARSATASTPNSTSCAGSAAPASRSSPSWKPPSAAHRHPVAQGALQPRLRLLHRDLEVEPARGARRLHPQADDCRRRALRHAGAEGVRGEGARRRRAQSSSASWSCSRPCAGRVGEPRPACSRQRARWRRSTCSPVWPRPPHSATTPSRTCTTATS